MIRWFVVLLLAWVVPAHAQSVVVSSGEHDGFTRLVLQSPQLAGWQLSRLPDGYALTLRQAAKFDLSAVYNPIGRQRLAAIAAEPQGRGLNITLGCACHAIGFDYRPGIVVIDLRDGPPPVGSSFELTAKGDQAAALQAPPAPEPPPAGLVAWDWTKAALEPQTDTNPPVGAPPMASADSVALRQALAGSLAQGAVQGLVDPVKHLPLAVRDAAPPDAGRLALVNLPGLNVDTALADPEKLTAVGDQCPADDRLDIASWGDPDRAAAPQMAEAAGFLREFDQPDPDAAARAIKLTLWLGFGAEAESMIAVFANDATDAPLWRGMARALDGRRDSNRTFAGMLGCDGQAAFWAAVAETRLLPPDVNEAAVLRSFSALPSHLRQLFGPSLVDRFLKGGDAVTARVLRDAMARGSGQESVRLVDADLALQSGQPELADSLAQAALADGGPSGADALVTMVEAHVASTAPLTLAEVTAVDALLEERSDEPNLQRAAVLAHALVGDFDRAFSLFGELPPASNAKIGPDLWALLAAAGPKGAVLTHAVLAADAEPLARPETRGILAQRLTEYGFGPAALRWLGSDADIAALGAAELASGQPRAALSRLSGRQGEGVVDLRAKALLQLGDASAAAQLWSEAGNSDARTDALLRAHDWASLRDDGPQVWQAAVQTLAPTPDAQGPLSSGRALVAQSSATRDALTALLDQTPRPTE